MSFVIYNDSISSSLTNYISQAYTNMYSALTKLSSGYKINSAADGPADLVISEQLRSQIASLSQEIENSSALIGKYSTASSSISELRTYLNDLRSSAVAAANEGGNNPDVQQAYVDEANNIVSYYNTAIDNATYNNVKLLDGSDGALANVSKLDGIDLSSAETAQASIDKIDSAISEVDNIQTDIGATQQNELQAHISSLEITRQNLQAAESNLYDTDFALEFSTFLAEQIKFKAGLSLMSHLALSSNAVLGLINGN
ncbi:MAG: hypothetical protein GXO93_00565 [FCB group bacterium]|nr:hypothetical protein [FCB group bacterium]